MLLLLLLLLLLLVCVTWLAEALRLRCKAWREPTHMHPCHSLHVTRGCWSSCSSGQRSQPKTRNTPGVQHGRREKNTNGIRLRRDVFHEGIEPQHVK